jgi:hypothetical protein
MSGQQSQRGRRGRGRGRRGDDNLAFRTGGPGGLEVSEVVDEAEPAMVILGDVGVAVDLVVLWKKRSFRELLASLRTRVTTPAAEN